VFRSGLTTKETNAMLIRTPSAALTAVPAVQD
jgi:hypothetical protein